MEENKGQTKQQPGSGSAENTGEGRDRQLNTHTDLSKQERTNMAGEMGQGPNPITTVKEMGGLSGRDDAAGGSGDRMEGESTGEETSR